jgi:hypothetical protein
VVFLLDFHSGGSETDGEQFAARNDLGQSVLKAEVLTQAA